jgi:signal peptidase II
VRRFLRTRWPQLVLLAGVVALDQFTKSLVDRFMTLHETRAIVSGLLDLTYVRNRGAAFGILAEAHFPHQSLAFALVGIVALVAIVVYALRLPPGSRLPQTALALVMGGALGNLVDRARHGFVIDFIDAYWGPHHWPAFNVADAAISVGVTLLVLDMLWSSEPRPSADPAISEAATPGRSE